MAAVIEVIDLAFRYPDGTRALNGVSFSVPEGARVALLGPNGAGKSTLLLHLNGLNLPRQGSVKIRGREVGKKTKRWVRAEVGIVFQDPDDQIFSSTVWDDVAFGPVNMGLSGHEVDRRVQNSLRAVGMLAYREKPPYRLSYGQKKRVAIAGVLAMEPKVIVLDEPMAFLDPAGKKQVERILDNLNRNGTTIIIATHDVDLAARWADRVIILRDGRVLAEGEPGLLTEKRLVEGADLTCPLIAQVFLELPEWDASPVPFTVAQAVSEIRRLLKTKP